MDGGSQQRSRRRLHLVVFLGCVVFSLLLYHKTTSYYFSGDIFDVLGPFSKANLTKAFLAPESHSYRPVPRFNMLVLFTLFGRNPFWYHLVNLLTHALCGFLVYLLARRLRDDTTWAVLAGALFICMPVHFDAVSTVFLLTVLISTCLLLASLLLYMKSAVGERPRVPWLSAVVYFLALMTKQSTASMLLVMVAWELFFQRRGQEFWRYVMSRVKHWLPFVGAIALAAALNLMAKPSDPDVGMVLPISLSYRLPVFLLSLLVKAANPWFLPGLAIMVAAPLIKGGKLARFSLLAVALLPFPFYALTSDRHAYLPAVGLALALAALLRNGVGAVLAPPSSDAPECVPRARPAAPMIVDLLLLGAIFGFFLMPYRAPDPALLGGNGAASWHSQVDPAYWRSTGILLQRLATTGSLASGALSAKRALLMLASLANLIAIVGLLVLRATRWRGPLNRAAWKATRVGVLLVFFIVFSATTYSTSGKDWRLDAWKADAAVIEMKKNYPDLPDKTSVYVSDDVLSLLARLQFYYDLKDVSAKKYSDFFGDVAKGEALPDAERMRCFVFEDGRLVRKESDEVALREKLKVSWRPEYSDSEIALGKWAMPRLPDTGAMDDRWQMRRFSSGGCEVQELLGQDLDGKMSLCYSELSVPTLAVNEAELIFGAAAKDSGLHKVWLLWQLDSARWFGRQFDLPYDGVVRKLTFKLSGSREWFLADELSGLCLVFEEEPDTIQVEAFNLMFGLRVGMGVTRFPGGEEQLDLALEEIFKVK